MAALPRSCKLLCSGREEASRLKEAQVRHRFVVPHRRVWMWKNGSVEERLFRAASACAFDCRLQPRPALKGIHPPAVAAMNGRSSTLTQALVLRARRNTPTGRNQGAAQVRGNHPCVSNTWRNKEMGQPQSVPVSGNGGPARHHVTRKCRIILFTLVIPRAPLGPKNLLSRRIASTQQMPRLPIRLVFLPHLAARRKVQAAVR